MAEYSKVQPNKSDNSTNQLEYRVVKVKGSKSKSKSLMKLLAKQSQSQSSKSNQLKGVEVISKSSGFDVLSPKQKGKIKENEETHSENDIKTTRMPSTETPLKKSASAKETPYNCFKICANKEKSQEELLVIDVEEEELPVIEVEEWEPEEEVEPEMEMEIVIPEPVQNTTGNAERRTTSPPRLPEPEDEELKFIEKYLTESSDEESDEETEKAETPKPKLIPCGPYTTEAPSQSDRIGYTIWYIPPKDKEPLPEVPDICGFGDSTNDYVLRKNHDHHDIFCTRTTSLEKQMLMIPGGVNVTHDLGFYYQPLDLFRHVKRRVVIHGDNSAVAVFLDQNEEENLKEVHNSMMDLQKNGDESPFDSLKTILASNKGFTVKPSREGGLYACFKCYFCKQQGILTGQCRHQVQGIGKTSGSDHSNTLSHARDHSEIRVTPSGPIIDRFGSKAYGTWLDRKGKGKSNDGRKSHPTSRIEVLKSELDVVPVTIHSSKFDSSRIDSFSEDEELGEDGEKHGWCNYFAICGKSSKTTKHSSHSTNVHSSSSTYDRDSPLSTVRESPESMVRSSPDSTNGKQRGPSPDQWNQCTQFPTKSMPDMKVMKGPKRIPKEEILEDDDMLVDPKKSKKPKGITLQRVLKQRAKRLLELRQLNSMDGLCKTESIIEEKSVMVEEERKISRPCKWVFKTEKRKIQKCQRKNTASSATSDIKEVSEQDIEKEKSESEKEAEKENDMGIDDEDVIPEEDEENMEDEMEQEEKPTETVEGKKGGSNWFTCCVAPRQSLPVEEKESKEVEPEQEPEPEFEPEPEIEEEHKQSTLDQVSDFSLVTVDSQYYDVKTPLKRTTSNENRSEEVKVKEKNRPIEACLWEQKSICNNYLLPDTNLLHPRLNNQDQDKMWHGNLLFQETLGSEASYAYGDPCSIDSSYMSDVASFADMFVKEYLMKLKNQGILDSSLDEGHGYVEFLAFLNQVNMTPNSQSKNDYCFNTWNERKGKELAAFLGSL